MDGYFILPCLNDAEHTSAIKGTLGFKLKRAQKEVKEELVPFYAIWLPPMNTFFISFVLEVGVCLAHHPLLRGWQGQTEVAVLCPSGVCAVAPVSNNISSTYANTGFLQGNMTKYRITNKSPKIGSSLVWIDVEYFLHFTEPF